MVLCDWGREVPKVYSDTRNTTCKCTHWHSWRKRRGDWDKVVRRKSTTVGEGLGVSYLVVIIEALRATLLIGHLLQGCRARLRRQERGRHTRGSVLKHSEDTLCRIAIVSLPFWLSARWDPPPPVTADGCAGISFRHIRHSTSAHSHRIDTISTPYQSPSFSQFPLHHSAPLTDWLIDGDNWV